jgi:integrase
MASIVPYRGGWRAYVYVGKKRRTKTFRLESEAKKWADAVEIGAGATTFAVAAERFLALKLPSLENADNQRTYEQSIRDHVLPVIGHKKLTDIRRPELVSLVRGIAAKGRVETSRRIGQRIRAIFDHAIDEGEIESHPAAGLSRVLPTPKVQHMPAISPAELPELLRAIRTYREPVTMIGLLLMAHWFVRTTELIGVRWDEFKDDVLVIPGARMKRGLDHVVPVSPVARALLAELEPMTGESPFVLASSVNPMVPISSNTLLFALYRLGYKGRMTGHGFRAVASSVLNESGLWSRDAIERQLAHQETDDVRAAYHRAQYLDERRRMMAWYSSYLGALAATKTS